MFIGRCVGFFRGGMVMRLIEDVACVYQGANNRINAIEIGKEEQEVPPQNGAGLPAFGLGISLAASFVRCIFLLVIFCQGSFNGAGFEIEGKCVEMCCVAVCGVLEAGYGDVVAF
jgi:hypothetical protein